MTHRLAVLVIAACGTPPAPPQRPVDPPHVPTDAAVATTPSAMPGRSLFTPVASPRRAIEAPHAGEIRTIALTDDGTAAITADELGGVRLWRTLDGGVEPHVVDLVAPRDLELAATKIGFFVGALDEVGNLMLLDLDADGRVLRHATIGGDATFVGMAMTARGLLAWRTDHTLELYSPDGALIERGGTEPGQRLVKLAARAHHAAAIVETIADDKPVRIVRTLALEPHLQWGATITLLPAASELAISPNNTSIAAVIQPVPGKNPELAIVEVESGKQVTLAPIAATSKLAYADDTTIAISHASGISWFTVGKDKPAATIRPAANTPALAAGGGHAVSRVSGELVIATPTDTAFLGYDLETPTVAAAGPDGKLVIGLAQQLAMLDGKLALVDAGVPQVPPDMNVADLEWAGNADWLVEGSHVKDGTTQVLLVSSDGRPAQVVRDKMSVVQPLKYDRTSHLATLSLAIDATIHRYDPVKRRVDHVATIARGAKSFEETELLPVSGANGVQMIKVALRTKAAVEWMTDAKATSRAATATVDSFITADAAGHVFGWNNQPSGPLQLDVYNPNGTRAGSLPFEGPVGLWPDPAGTRVVEIGQQAVALYGLDGKLAWTQSIAGAHQALWLTDGSIAIVTAVGIARLDAATGAVVTARCGWRFNLAKHAHPPSPRIESVCTQVER